MLIEACTQWTKAHKLIRCGEPITRYRLILRGGQHYATKSQFKKQQRLPTSPARTRFAPSPTGFLHLGSLRTALYSYLLAKATGGQFILRIEDTDEARTVPSAEDRICRDLEWAGLRWDEGPEVGGPYGPYKQSERNAIYNEHAHQLLEEGHAYKCFCTQERLAALAERRSQLGLPSDYDRTCASLATDEIKNREANGEKYVIRLKVPDVYPVYTDLVYGSIGKLGLKKPLHKAGERYYEDPVMIKSNGQPTYHLANVIDDHLMKITHVVRGVEWMPSTPKHIMLYNAFGWQPPQFAHVGLLVDKTGQKLSKRSRDIDLEAYREGNYFPEAVINYAALLGWSHSLGNDFLPTPELIKNFTLRFTKGNTIVETGKLKYLQKLYAQKLVAKGSAELPSITADIESIARGEYKDTVNLDIDYSNLAPYIGKLLQTTAGQYRTPQDFFERNLYFFRTPAWPKPVNEASSDPQDKRDRYVVNALQQLSQIPPDRWNEVELKESLHMTVLSVSKQLSEPLTEETRVRHHIFRVLRTILLAGRAGPALVDTMLLLGRDVTLKRVKAAAADLDVQE